MWDSAFFARLDRLLKPRSILAQPGPARPALTERGRSM